MRVNNSGSGHSFVPASFLKGVKKALPIVMGYLPVAFAFGVLASEAGFSALEAGFMSFLVFAGSGQLIAVNMLLAGVSSPLSIIATTFVVNFRHILMSAAMLPYLGKWSKKLQLFFCFEMTDETFAMNISTFSEIGVDRDEALGVNITSHLGWVTGGIFGGIFGNMIDNLKPYGLDFALAGMFIALIVPHLRIPRHLCAALIGGSTSTLLYLYGVEQWCVIIATVFSATLCLLLPFPEQKKHTVASGKSTLKNMEAKK